MNRTVLTVAAVGGVVLALLAGALIGGAAAPEPLATKVLRSGPASVVAPRDQRVGVSLAPNRPAPRGARETRVAGYRAWTYSDVTVLPTTAGALTVTCAGCASAIESVSVKGAAILEPTPELALALRLPGVAKTLDRARVSARKGLRAAKTPEDQGRWARRLAAAHRDAAAALEPMAAGSALLDRLSDAGRAYAALGRAAAGSAPDFDAARERVRTADTQLARALGDVAPVTAQPRADARSRTASHGPSLPLLALIVATFGALGVGLALSTGRPRPERQPAAAPPTTPAPSFVATTAAAPIFTLVPRPSTPDPARVPVAAPAPVKPATAPSPSRGRVPGAAPAPVQRAAAPTPPAPVQRAAAPTPPAPVLRAAAPTQPAPVQRATAPTPPPSTPTQPAPVQRAATPAPPAPVLRAAPPAPPALVRRAAAPTPAPPAPVRRTATPTPPPTAPTPPAPVLRAAAPAPPAPVQRAATPTATPRVQRSATPTPPTQPAPVQRPAAPTAAPPPTAPAPPARVQRAAAPTPAPAPPAPAQPARPQRAAAPAPRRATAPPPPQSAPPTATWHCELTWSASLRSATFSAKATAPGQPPRLVASSAKLSWPPLMPPTPKPELIAAARVVARALLNAGWTPTDKGSSWYSQRFAWTRDGAPPELGTVQRRAAA